MLGDRTNYGQRDQGRRYTLKLYGKLHEIIEQVAQYTDVSVADVVVETLKIHYGIPNDYQPTISNTQDA